MMIIDRRAIAWFIGAVATTIVACGPTTTVHVKRGAGLLGVAAVLRSTFLLLAPVMFCSLLWLGK